MVFVTIAFWGCRTSPNACFTATETTVNPGESITFTSCSDDAESYRWDMGDGTEATGSTVEHSYSAPGTYLVELAAIHKNERMLDRTSKLITVNDTTEGPLYITNIRVLDFPETKPDGSDWDTPPAPGVPCPDGCPWPDVFVRMTISQTGWTFNTSTFDDVNPGVDLPISWDLSHLTILLDNRNWNVQMRDNEALGSELMNEWVFNPYELKGNGLIRLEEGDFIVEIEYEERK